MTSCSLVFPCHNEEEAIPGVLAKALKAKEHLEGTGISLLEIIAVNDGSTDSSQKLLDSYSNQIKVLHLKKQRGYGAALKEGFSKASGNWLGFCDLDSTCEPEELSLLLKTALQGNYSLVWGQRIHKKSSMPSVRVIGNRLFSLALYLLSFQYVSDPCSGFRIFKKDQLGDAVFQFPDDLSFSLALTSYCIREKISFKELAISYHERTGQSKLHSLKDGLIFLKTIADVLIFKKY